MLAVFEKSVAGVKVFGMTFPAAQRSENLPTDDSVDSIKEIAKRFKDSYPSSISMDILPSCVLASQLDHHSIITPSFLGVKEDVICLFRGRLTNVGSLKNSYGLKDEENVALLVINVYKKLYGEEEALWLKAVSSFQGDFSFIIYDAKKIQFFVATDPVGTSVKCYWGSDSQGNQCFSNDYDFGTGCSTFYGHIPGGHFVASGRGLRKLQSPSEQIKMEPLNPDDIL